MAGESLDSMPSFGTNLGYLINDCYKPIIIEYVDFRSVVPKLPFMRKIAPKVHEMTLNGDKNGAAETFMTSLKEIEELGKYQAFFQVLKDLGYTLIVDAIEKGEVKEHQEEHKRLLELFKPLLLQTIHPQILAFELSADGVIMVEDAERIRNLSINHSNYDAAFYLLDTIPRKDPCWYDKFMNLLVSHNQVEIVKEIDSIWYDKNHPVTDPMVEDEHRNSDTPKTTHSLPGKKERVSSHFEDLQMGTSSSNQSENTTSVVGWAKTDNGIHQNTQAQAEFAGLVAPNETCHCQCQRVMEEIVMMKDSFHAGMGEFAAMRESFREDLGRIERTVKDILRKLDMNE